MYHIIDNHSNIHCNLLKIVKYKYISNYMLIYAKILKSANCLDILHADA